VETVNASNEREEDRRRCEIIITFKIASFFKKTNDHSMAGAGEKHTPTEARGSSNPKHRRIIINPFIFKRMNDRQKDPNLKFF
jgi:hypothetical protein